MSDNNTKDEFEVRPPRTMKSELQFILRDMIASAWKKSELRIEILAVETKLDIQALTITPDAGWDGKNETERKASKERALLHDPQYQELKTNLDEARERLEFENTVTECSSIKLRVIDLFIRDQVNVLAGGVSAVELITIISPSAQSELDFSAPEK